MDLIKSRFEELNRDDANKIFTWIPITQRKSIQVLIKKVLSDSSIINDLKQFIKVHNKEQLISGFLNNGEESNCFERQQFNQIGSSVVAKVDFFVKLINEYATYGEDKKKKSSPDTVDIRALSPGTLVKRLTLGSWLIVASLVSGTFWVGYKFNSPSPVKDTGSIQINPEDPKKANNDRDSLFKDLKKLTDSIIYLNNENKKLKSKHN